MSESRTITTQWSEYNPTGLIPKFIANRYDDKRGNRFYYFRDNGVLKAAAGITTWLSQVMPESSFLTDWKIKWGKDWRTILDLTSDYGTTMHTCAAYMLKKEPIQPELILLAHEQTKRLQKYDKSIPSNMIEKNIISFQKFLEDFTLKPLLIEAVLICECNGGYYAMTQDLLAEIEVETKVKTEVQDGFYLRGANKGKPKMVTKTEITKAREIVCIDMKSNPFNKDKKGLFDSHLYQLIGTKKAVKQNFGIEVNKIFNWSPNSWKSDVGSYTLHEWKVTDYHEKKFRWLEQGALLDGLFTPNGKIEVFRDWEPGIKSSEMYQSREYLEHINSMT